MATTTLANANNVLTQEERRTFSQSAHAAGRFTVNAFKNIVNKGERQFPSEDDFNQIPRPTFNELTKSEKNEASDQSYVHDAPSRSESLALLLKATDPHKPLDVLVIGGGATGTGIALDLASRAAYTRQRKDKLSTATATPEDLPFSVGLVEANDFASETSSRSSKLIHGGVRYLEKAVFGFDFQQLKLVFEALSERSILAHQAPFLVHPIETIIPCYSLYDAILFWVGMKTYDLLAVLGGGVVGGFSGFHFSTQTRVYYPHLMGKRDFSLVSAPPSGAASSGAARGALLVAFNKTASTISSALVFVLYPFMLAFALLVTLAKALWSLFSNTIFKSDNVKTSSSSNFKDGFCGSVTHVAATASSFITSILSSSRLLGAVTYFDGQHHDARLCLHVAITAGTYGAACVNHCRLTGIKTLKNPHATGPDDFVQACTIKDSLTNTTKTIYAKSIVNATGPFSDAVRKLIDEKHSNKVRPSHGTHITLPPKYAPKDRAMLIPSNDGRVIFCISYLGHCIAGTTDAVSAVEESPKAPEKDVEFILNNLRPHLGPIDRSEVVSVWCGIRPLAAPETAHDGSSGSSQSIVREHSIHADVKGRILSITGGKWTTYRKMAHDAVTVLIEQGMVDATKLMWNAPEIDNTTSNVQPELLLDDSESLTAKMVLFGARSLRQYTTLPATLAAVSASPVSSSSSSFPDGNNNKFALPYLEAAKKLAAANQMPLWVILHWIQTYGDKVEVLIQIAKGEKDQHPAATASSFEKRRVCPSLPTVTADIRYSCRYESCERIQDFIARRSALAFLSVEETKEFGIKKVAEVMAEEKGWNAATREAEVADAISYLDTFEAKP